MKKYAALLKLKGKQNCILKSISIYNSNFSLFVRRDNFSNHDNMAFLATVGLLTLLYYLAYLIFPSILDCDLLLAFKEIFGKPVGKCIYSYTGLKSGEKLFSSSAVNQMKYIKNARLYT